MPPPSNEHLEISIQNGLDLWLGAQKFVKMVIYKLLEFISPKTGFCKDITGKENDRSMSLVNKDLKKYILADQIWQYIAGVYIMTRWGFVSRIPSSFCI